jgi:hypothetical protein
MPGTQRGGSEGRDLSAAQPFRELILRHRSGEEIALGNVATGRLQTFENDVRLNSLTNNAGCQIVTKFNDRSDDRANS